ncbi:hypothetical protein M080_5307, partial [Bacteroides fragilis str. 3397 T10]
MNVYQHTNTAGIVFVCRIVQAHLFGLSLVRGSF